MRPAQHRASIKRRSERQREALTDGYLRSHYFAGWPDVPQALLDLKRDILKLKRAVKESNHGCD